jgi:hypothetical protein
MERLKNHNANLRTTPCVETGRLNSHTRDLHIFIDLICLDFMAYVIVGLLVCGYGYRL